MLLIVVCACGGEDDSGGGATSATFTDSDLVDETGRKAVVVQARDNVFLNEAVQISTATEVTFNNRGRNPHNVVPVDDEAFDPIEVDDFQPGDEATITFDEAGIYAYYCTLHGTETAGMIGTIVVEG